jgi:hypothetical protein
MFFDAVLTFLFVFSGASLKSGQLIQGAIGFSPKIQTIVESPQTGNKDGVGFYTLRKDAGYA